MTRVAILVIEVAVMIELAASVRVRRHQLVLCTAPDSQLKVHGCLMVAQAATTTSLR